MPLQFGVGKLTVSGIAIARLYNCTVNITYDNAVMRGDTRVFGDHCTMYNGNVEGSFEWGELTPSGLGDLLGGTGTFAAGSGTWRISATNFPISGVSIVFSGVTDGITCTVTLNSVKINSMTLTFDRENYLMPTCNFIAVGDATNDNIISIQM